MCRRPAWCLAAAGRCIPFERCTPSGCRFAWCRTGFPRDRKSTRLNSSHVAISYAVFCLKKKTTAELREVRPEAGAKSSQIGRAERRRFLDRGHFDRHAEEVGLKLHEKRVGGATPIHLEQ